MKIIMLLIPVLSLLSLVHGDNSTLECAQCNLGESCQHKMNCTDAGMLCVHLEVANTFEESVNRAYKGCIAPSSCMPFTLTMSIATGRQVRSNLACCATSGCNDQLSLSVPPASSLRNGVYCPACENQNKSLCEGLADVPCTGAEEMCIALEGVSIGKSDHNFSMRGCATPSACTLKENNLMSFGGDVYMLTQNVICTNKGSQGGLPFPATRVFQVMAGLLLANVLFCPSLVEGPSSSL